MEIWCQSNSKLRFAQIYSVEAKCGVCELLLLCYIIIVAAELKKQLHT